MHKNYWIATTDKGILKTTEPIWFMVSENCVKAGESKSDDITTFISENKDDVKKWIDKIT